MSISVWVRNERQRPLASLQDVLHLVPPPLPPGWYEPLASPQDRHTLPMLAHIDPYGNTIFNRPQMSTLLEKLARLEPQLAGVTLGTARALRMLIGTYADKPHRYLWFIGD